MALVVAPARRDNAHAETLLSGSASFSNAAGRGDCDADVAERAVAVFEGQRRDMRHAAQRGVGVYGVAEPDIVGIGGAAVLDLNGIAQVSPGSALVSSRCPPTAHRSWWHP